MMRMSHHSAQSLLVTTSLEITTWAAADSDAMYAYLQTLAPVSNVPPKNKIPFPLNMRFLMAIWNVLYFHKGEYVPDPAKSAQWNRGAYLVKGPGHCGD